ncbi:YeeE/YedE family protein [Paeniglutamicibacter antarcticus]|uniref:YeeE/YedE family protein n=1 Tax=Arthrobacter terrae TaxID=2935737 RepID=A0A931G6A4_9MICC|nr:YeeE/YedE family protein [Arthrobacter terrae]MBG0740440.1 YeeE/YedE family protein [Arthrobacter terrae]
MPITGLLLGTALGFAMQRGRFCVTGAFRDVWISRNTRWLTAFMMVIAIQSAGIFALAALGVIDLQSKAFPWLATIVGAFIFGFAIVLAGGCATGTYYRSGEGLVGSWLALVFYALFSSIMKTGPLAQLTALLRGITVRQGNIYQTLGISPWVLVALLAAVVVIMARHHLARPGFKMAALPPEKTGLAHLLFEKPWGAFASAAVIGIIAIAAWPLSSATGRNDGLGITTPSANLIGFLTTGNIKLVDWGVYLVLGLLLGSFAAAKTSGEFRVRVPDAKQAVKSVAGGALMGVGASLAGGCTIGNAMVQTAQFSFQGWVAFGVMILGTGAAAKLTIRRTGSTAPAVAKPARSSVGV